jgi:copper(I)-binding protein
MTAALLSVLVLTFIPAGSGCRSGEPSLGIESSQALLSPMIIGSGSVFLNIVNSGNGPDKLTGARVDLPGTLTELHDMHDDKMVRTDYIPVPPGTLRLRPAGPHIMIFRLPKDKREGSVIPLILFFEHSGQKKVSVTIVNNFIDNLGR